MGSRSSWNQVRAANLFTVTSFQRSLPEDHQLWTSGYYCTLVLHLITRIFEMFKKQETSPSPESTLKSFVSEDPNSKYTFNSVERDAKECEMCREGGQLSRKCIKIQMHSTKMFEAMQKQGFFCVLPMDPARTHIECTRIPSS